MKKTYFIDSENVGDNWISLLSVMDEKDEILVFYTAKSPHMTYRNIITLKQSDRDIKFIECYEGRNALDFQLATELGYRLRDIEDGEYIIVTDDNGYDAFVKYWKRRKMAVKRIHGKTCGILAKEAAAQKENAEGKALPAAVDAVEALPTKKNAEKTSEILTQKKESEDNEILTKKNAEDKKESLVQKNAGAEKEPLMQKSAETEKDLPAQEAAETAKELPEQTTVETAKELPEQPTAETEKALPEQKVTAMKNELSEQKTVEAEKEVPEQRSAEEEEALPGQNAAETQKELSVQKTAEIKTVLPMKKESVEENISGKQTDVSDSAKKEEDAAEQKITGKKTSDKKNPAKNAADKKASDKKAVDKKSKANNQKQPKGELMILSEKNETLKVSAPENTAEELPKNHGTDEQIPIHAKEILYIVGKENLQTLHEALRQIFGADAGKRYYTAFKPENAFHSFISRHQKLDLADRRKLYCSIVAELSEDEIYLPDDFSEFIMEVWPKKRNLNSFRASLEKKYTKAKGDQYYALIKAHIKILDKLS